MTTYCFRELRIVHVCTKEAQVSKLVSGRAVVIIFDGTE